MRPKRLISLLVAVCMMITMLPLSAVTAFAADTSSSTVYEATVDGYKYAYTVNADGNATITDFLGPVASTSTGSYDITIPEKLDDHPVTGLGESSFSGTYSPDHPKNYTLLSFCNQIQSVTIPESVTSIGKSAFEDCSNLDSLTIKGVATSIGAYAFGSCTSLTSLSLVGSFQTIGDYAFAYTPHINGNATISSGDSRVPGGLLLPDSLTYLGEGAFLYNGYLVFTYNSQTLQVAMSDLSSSYTGIIAVQFGEGLTEVGDAAFSYNANLAAIIDFGSLTAIAPSMFEGCAELSSVTLPDTIRTIGLGAFANCTSLEEIELPEGLTEIAQAVFAGTALTQIDLPSTVTAIGESAFEGVAISSVDLTNVTTIGARAFYGTLLTEVSSDSVISVGDEALSLIHI